MLSILSPNKEVLTPETFSYLWVSCLKILNGISNKKWIIKIGSLWWLSIIVLLFRKAFVMYIYPSVKFFYFGFRFILGKQINSFGNLPQRPNSFIRERFILELCYFPPASLSEDCVSGGGSI